MVLSESGSTSPISSKYLALPLAASHFLLALFSLGFLGIASRTCAVDTCTAQLGFLVATGVISFVVSALLGLFFLLNTYQITVWGWALDLFLLIWWGAALGFTMHYIEALTTPYAQPFVAFAWCAIALSLLCFLVSAICNPCCTSKSYEEFDAENQSGGFGARIGLGNLDPNNNNSTSQHPNARGQLERQGDTDFVPEEIYMSGNQGDPNYDASNVIGRLAPMLRK